MTGYEPISTADWESNYIHIVWGAGKICYSLNLFCLIQFKQHPIVVHHQICNDDWGFFWSCGIDQWARRYATYQAWSVDFEHFAREKKMFRFAFSSLSSVEMAEEFVSSEQFARKSIIINHKSMMENVRWKSRCVY